MRWSEERIESLNLIELIQDTSQNKWYSQGIAEYASFFYLLHWKSEGIFKFGYKLSQESFKKDYARYNHKTPDHSKIWLALETNQKFKSKFFKIDSIHLHSYIKDHEAIAHRNLKANFKKLNLYNEVYLSNDIKSAEEIIRRSLVDFNIKSYRSYSNEKTEEAVRKFSV